MLPEYIRISIHYIILCATVLILLVLVIFIGGFPSHFFIFSVINKRTSLIEALNLLILLVTSAELHLFTILVR